MSNFFVALFINNRVCQYKIDELIQNSFNGYVSENFAFGNQHIYFPVLIEGNSYSLQSKAPAYRIACGLEEIGEYRELRHGDYLVFSKGELSYAALIIDYSLMSLSEAVFELGGENIFIGRAEDSHIVLDLNANISRKCAAIRKDENGKYHIEDLSGKTGVYVNGHREMSKELADGDEIYIMGTTILYYGNMLVLPSHIKTNRLKAAEEFDMLTPVERTDESLYVRTPRIIKSQEGGKINIDPPPAPQKSKEMPFILTAGPSITMSLAMLASVGVTISNALQGGGFASLITSGVMAISMLAGALLWPILLRRYTKRQEEANELYRRQRYSAYLAQKEQEIRQKYDRNIRVLNENHMPSPQTLAGFIADKNRRLWERVPNDDDFLLIRLGKGEMEFGVEIQAPNKGFVLEDDPMVDSAIALKNKYSKMPEVPIAISLAEKRVVGAVGAIFDVFKIIVSNIVALHASDEVKLVLLYNASDMKKLQWANDLPHVWSNDRKQRYVATNREEALSLLSSLDETILEREEVLQRDDKRIPTYVVLVLDETLVEDTPFKRHLINPENAVGVSTVFFGKKFSSIPKECVAIIQKDPEVCGIYVKNENNNRFINYVSDEISDELIARIAQGINKIPVKTEKSKESVPDRVTFLDMYRVGNVDALEIMNHWATNISEKSLGAPIGIKAGGETFSLDIHEKFHGCHGLVAGTTGSGKSEFLQAYILSMMINYSPNEVAFVLVDFKGGDMARPFLKSPHLAATISNLSGNTLHRALISLEAEVKNRQNIFNRSAEKLGVDKIDINSYHKHFKDKKLTLPLPHLIIVIDEFAQLKSQHPEFMAKLVDIAQVGRSLGIHLILATQRPSGVVDPQIWSNSKFKVCLKVLDKQDSMDMIGRPEAALIKQPGRAYVQVGYDEIFEQIQSGYSGADYVEQQEYIDEDSISVSMVNWHAEKIRTAKKAMTDTKSERTQLEEVISVLALAGESRGLRVKQLWLPPLPVALTLETCLNRELSFDQGAWDKTPFGDVICGIADLPEKQEQRPYAVNFLQNGHLAIYGSSGVGKSALIQTLLFEMALQYSPEMLNVFALDFDGNSLASVAAMPHCVKYATDSDEKGVDELFRMVQNIITERRELFAGKHCANYESYINCSDEKMPMILLVLDNYAAFREKMYRSEDVLVQLVSAARSCGIYLIVTGNSKGAIYYKVTEHIQEKIVLNMNDSGSYRDVLNVPVPITPDQAKGRGLALVDKKAVEVQLAVPFDVRNESVRTGRMQSIYEQMAKVAQRAAYTGADVTKIEARISETATFVTVYKSSALPVEALPDAKNNLIVGYDIGSGEAKGFDLSHPVCAFIGTNGDRDAVLSIVNRLSAHSDKQVYVVTSHEADDFDCNADVVEDIDEFVTQLCETDEDEARKIVLAIDGFCDFYDRISDEALARLEKALKQGVSFSIVTFDDMQRWSDYGDTGLFVRLVRTECGAIVKGQINDAVASYLATTIYEIPRDAREKELKSRQAAVYCGNKISYVAIERS